jgi:tetratricopeptide (TPR) repeat protein
MCAEDFSLAFQSLREGLRLSEEVNEIIATVLANYYLGVAYTFNCQFELACRHIGQAHEINRAVKNLWGMSVMESHLTLPFNYQGAVDVGFRHSEQAVQLAEESGDIFSKAMAYTLHGFSCYYLGQLEAAIEHLQIGAALGERMNYFAWNAVTHFYLAETLFEKHAFVLAQDYYEKAIWFLEKNVWFPSFLNLNRVALVRAQVFSARCEVDLEALSGYVEGNKLKLFDGKIRRYLGEILAARGEDLDAAEAWLRAAIAFDTRHAENCELGEDHAAMAQLKARQDDLRGAREHWEAAIDCYRRCRVDARLARCRRECRPSAT